MGNAAPRQSLATQEHPNGSHDNRGHKTSWKERAEQVKDFKQPCLQRVESAEGLKNRIVEIPSGPKCSERRPMIT